MQVMTWLQRRDGGAVDPVNSEQAKAMYEI